MDNNPVKRSLNDYYVPVVVVSALVCVFVVTPLVGLWRERNTARRSVTYSSYAPVKDFFEHKQAIDQLLVALRPREDCAAVVLIRGMSDVGKTQLARYAMCRREITEAYPDGVLPLDLHGIDPETHPREIGNALRELLSKLSTNPARYNDSDLTDLIDIYRSELKGRRLLIVLDNLDEHINKWQDLIYEEAAGCAFLITSQSHLSLPPHTITVQLDPLTKKEAARFLEHIARAGNGPRLAIDSELADEICRLCGYLPLTIRMAVEAMRDPDHPHTPADFVRELAAESDRALSRGGGSLETRAAIALSYKILPTEAQRTLLRLNIFQSPFEAEAEEAVAEDPGHSHLKKLERRSLVLFNEHTRRYRVHSLVRDFTAPLLEPADRRRAAARYAWYARRTLRAARQLPEAGQDDTRIVLLETALRVCNDLRSGSNIELPFLRAICLRDLSSAYFSANQLTQSIAYGNQALEVTGRASLRRVEAVVLSKVAIALNNIGERQKAIDLLKQALLLSREFGLRHTELEALTTMAAAYENLGEHDEALVLFHEALTLARALESPQYMLITAGVCTNLCNRGQNEAALELLVPALKVARENKLAYYEAIFLFLLGGVDLNLEKPDSAIERFQQALAVPDARLPSGYQSEIFRTLGNAYAELGRFDRAAFYLQRALEITQTQENHADMAAILHDIGRLAGKRYPLTAVRYYKHVLRVSKALGLLQQTGKTQHQLSITYTRMGNYPAALRHARQALEILLRLDLTNNLPLAEEIKATRGLIETLENGISQMRGANSKTLLEFADRGDVDFNKAEVPYFREEAEKQIKLYEENIDHFREVGSKDGEAGSELELSVLYGNLGEWPDALEHAQRAEMIYEELEETRPTPEARDSLAMARLQASLAKVELTPPSASDGEDGE